MENKVLEKNLQAISRYDKNLADKILMFDFEKANIGAVETELKEFNVVFNGIPLHSQQGAVLEAQSIVAKIENKENSLRIIYGLGLGYLLDEACEKLTNSKIILYEPNIEILKFVFSIAQIDAIYKNNVFVCSNKEQLANLAKRLVKVKTNTTISFLSSYKQMFEDDIKNVLNVVQNIQGEIIANKNTLDNKAPRALFNTFCNLDRTLLNPNLEDLKDVYKGKTALCLSAGQTLRENIEIIKENQDKFVIFAVNPTLKLLAQNGIKPDFILNIETNDTSPQFSEVNTKESYFILEPFSNEKVARFQTKKTFNYISDQFANLWVADCVKAKCILKSSGTVSFSALMSAYLMGFDKIILCGQDLAYKDGNCYAKGSQFEQLECVFDEEEKKYKIIARDYEAYKNSLKAKQVDEKLIESIAKSQLEQMNKNICTVKSQDGKELPTQIGYMLFIKVFEDAAFEIKKTRPNIELINSSFGGAQINGFENIKLEEVVKTLEPVEKLDLSQYNSKIDKPSLSIKLEQMEKEMTELLNLFEEGFEVNEKIIKEISIKKALTQNVVKLLKKHKDILCEIIKMKNAKEVKLVALIYIQMFIDLIDCDYFSDINEIKRVLSELNEMFEKIISPAKLTLQVLRDGKARILK